MRVQLVRPWQFRAVGTVLELPDGVAELLILQGRVCRVGEEHLDISIVPTQRVPKNRRVRATA